MIQRKTLIRIILGFAGVWIVIIGVAIYLNTRSEYDNYLSIANLGDYTNGKPSDKETLDYIKYDLYRAVNHNTKKAKENDSIKDILVRDGSFSQTKNNDSGVHTVSFIVDIASLKQSYGVSYQWTDDGARDERLDEWGTVVKCLPIHELKYGDFGCIDDRIKLRGTENYDPVDALLPHSVEYKYIIKKYTKEDGATTLDVEAFVPQWTTNKDAVLDGYSKEINAWLKSKKLDPDDYRLNYIY